MKYYIIRHIFKDNYGGVREYKIAEASSLEKAKAYFALVSNLNAMVTETRIVDSEANVKLKTRVRSSIINFSS